MKIIVGLGNPGKKFINTRHNVGFLALEALKKFQNSKIPKFQTNYKFKFSKRFNAEILQLTTNNSQLILVKPQTFMNSSGEAVKKVLHYYKKTIRTSRTLKHYNNLYVIHDDLDIELGEYKIQFGRGAAGHKGVESVIKELGTKDFWRVRIGINPTMSKVNPPAGGQRSIVKGEDFVLEKFSKKEKKIIDRVIEKIVKEVMSK